MTAEAIIMNRSAVALAADSAVTISGAEGMKTFEGANKLFELIKGSNIGVMIYSNAEINGTPWETVIKTFRTDHSTFHASHVEDYFDAFTKYVSEHPKLLKQEDEWLPVMRLSMWFAEMIFDYLGVYPIQLTHSNGNIIKTKTRAAVGEFCDKWEKALVDIPDITSGFADPEKTFRADFGQGILEYLNGAFKDLGLMPALIKRVGRLIIKAMSKEIRTPIDGGLVFAGFGVNDYFPKLISARVPARLSGELITHDREVAEVTVANPAHLQTFAQDDPARGWIDGISKDVRGEIQKHWVGWLTNRLPQRLQRDVMASAGITKNQAREVTKTVLELAKEQLRDFLHDMQEFEEENYTRPMINSVSQLPKDELGLLAESLVNITSLKQRMSIYDANTVGGAIDVALISIGDGFVWLNRKHYFNSELNPTWNLTHGARIAVTKSTAEEEI